jgi:hypothetical protein
LQEVANMHARRQRGEEVVGFGAPALLGLPGEAASLLVQPA